MAYRISDECILCGACEPECPVQAISEGDDQSIIDANKCVECEGHYDEPKCVSLCPVDCISHID